MLIYYVYAYLRNSGTPYYIGKGKNGRAYDKSHTTRPPKDRSKIVFLETNLTELGALALERRYIRWYGRILDGGILRNITEGGEGNSGPRSEEWRRNHSAKLTGKTLTKDHINKLKNVDRSYMKSDDYKLKMSQAKLGCKPSHSKHVMSPYGIYESKVSAILNLNISRYILNQKLKDPTSGYRII